MNPDDVAKKLSEESNIRILGDHRRGLIHASERTAQSGSSAMAAAQHGANLPAGIAFRNPYLRFSDSAAISDCDEF